jgi:hypothetical protein
VTFPSRYGLSEHPIEEHEAKDAAIKAPWERIDGIEAGRQTLIDSLWASIPSRITEWGYGTTVATGVLDVTPVTTELYEARSITIFVTTTTGAVLRLGDVTFPVPNRFTHWQQMNIMVRGSDPRRLTAKKTAAALGLIICGTLLPTGGHF